MDHPDMPLLESRLVLMYRLARILPWRHKVEHLEKEQCLPILRW